MFVLVWGYLALALLFEGMVELLGATGAVVPGAIRHDDDFKLPGEDVKTWRSTNACQSLADLAMGMEIVVNAHFSLRFFEQQVCSCAQ
jgi:hypothetical protein